MKRFFKKIDKSLLLLPLGFIFLSGFTTIINWGKKTFKQAPKHDSFFVKAAQPFIQKLTIYNQLTTIATFNVMLLTDSLRMLYVDYLKKNQAMSYEQEQTLRTRQLNENRYFITFYVIGYQKEHDYLTSYSLFTGEYQKANDMLKGVDAMWNMSMIVGGRQYVPESIRIVDLPLEYKAFFGADFSQFSTVYLVRFSAVDHQRNFIFSPDHQSSVIIRLTSPKYQEEMIWKNVQFYSK